MRFLFYSHDGLGLGHTRRHIAVATALTEMASEASVLLATGADDISRVGLPANIEVLKLPGLRKIENETYGSRRLQVPAEDIRAIRAALLRSIAKAYRPDVVLVDKHPFGAKGEFRNALKEIRKYGGRCALGLRDLLDTPETVANEWGKRVLKLICSYYDEVLVYGQQAVFDPISEYEFHLDLAARTHFCGYVVNPVRAPSNDDNVVVTLPEPDGRPVVLATTGGGEDGFFLLETFLRAAHGSNWNAIVIAGPLTPEQDVDKLRALARKAKAKFHTYSASLFEMFSRVDAVVCMGGYNTLVEAVSIGVPTVCVPRTSPRAEQYLRACAFERLGLIATLLPQTMTAENLRQKVDLTLKAERKELFRRARASLAFDGAHVAASRLLALAKGRHHGEVEEEQRRAG